MIFDGGINTSLEKGETIEDSLANMAAMQPALMVVRCGEGIDLKNFSQASPFPVLNAGWGTSSHPSQALLDVFTLRKYWKTFNDKKLLIVGDLKHSRVASSHIQLAQKLGYLVGQCAPAEFQSMNPQVLRFDSLVDGLVWADAVMALRFQFERHERVPSLDRTSYREKYGINPEVWKKTQKDCLLLHPGPINHGIEIDSEILEHGNCKILEQVQNGIFVREALIRTALGENV